MEDKTNQEVRLAALMEQAEAGLKELEAMDLSPAVRARLEGLKRSLTPEALEAEAERLEGCREQWAEKNMGFPPGITFQDIEIA